MSRDRRIGNLIVGRYAELDSIKRGSGYDRKLKAMAYVHHRDDYESSEVKRIATYDSNPRSYLIKYESGLCGYMMPEDDEWARLVPRSGIGSGLVRDSLAVEKNEAQVLEAISSLVFQGLSDSNFYSVMFQVSMDRDVAGVGYLQVLDGWDAGEEGLVFRCIDPQECVIADSWTGTMDVYIRKVLMSPVDVVRAYGSGRLEKVRKLLRGESGEAGVVEVYEAMLPSKGYLYEQDGTEVAFGTKKRYAHLVYVPMDEELVVESGFDEMPISVDRRHKDSEKMPYGRGLIEDCLEEIVKINDLSNCRELIVQNNAMPPMWAPNSLKGRFSGKPRSIVYGPDTGARPEPIRQNLDSSSILYDIEDMRKVLRGLIPVDLFETIMGSTDSRKTATEVSMKKNEAMILLSLQIGDMKRNLLEPVFKRSAKVMLRHMELPEEFGEDHREMLLKLVDSSRLELNSVFIRRLNAYLQNEGDDAALLVLQGLYQMYPQVLDAVKMDKWVQKYLQGKGLPIALVASEEEMKQARQARAEIQQAQLESQLNAENAKANAQNAKAGREMGI